MTPEEALKHLGLASGASVDDIEGAYQSLRKQARHDAMGGQGGAELASVLEKLNEARDRAVADAGPERPESEAPTERPAGTTGGVGSGGAIPYELRREIKFEGPGRLFNAIHKETGSPAVVFLLDEGTFADRAHAESYVRAVREQPEPSGRNLVRGRDAGVSGTGAWVALPPLRGATLSTILSIDGQLDPNRAVFTALEVAAGLRELHAARPHGDVRPGTVWMSQAGQIQILDLVFTSLRELVDPRVSLAAGESSQHTAPELHLSGEQPTTQSDQFALAVLAERLLESADGAGAPDLSGATGRAKTRDPSARFPDVDAFGDAVRASVLGPRSGDVRSASGAGSGAGTKRVVLAGAAILTLGALGAGAFVWFSGSDPVPEPVGRTAGVKPAPAGQLPNDAEGVEETPESTDDPVDVASADVSPFAEPDGADESAGFGPESLVAVSEGVADRLLKNKERVDGLIQTWNSEIASSWRAYPMSSGASVPRDVAEAMSAFDSALLGPFEDDIGAEEASTRIRVVGSTLSDAIERFERVADEARSSRDLIETAVADIRRWNPQADLETDSRVIPIRNSVESAMANLAQGSAASARENFEDAGKIAANQSRAIADDTARFAEEVERAAARFGSAEDAIAGAEQRLQEQRDALRDLRRDLDSASENEAARLRPRIAETESEVRILELTVEQFQGSGRIGEARANARSRLAEWSGVALEVASQQTREQLSAIQSDIEFVDGVASSVEAYQRIAAPASAARERWANLPRLDSLPGGEIDLDELYAQEGAEQENYLDARRRAEELDFAVAASKMEQALNWFDRNSRAVERAWRAGRQETVEGLRSRWQELWEPLENTRFVLPGEIAEAEAAFEAAELALESGNFARAEESFATGIGLLRSQIERVTTMKADAERADERGRTPLHRAAMRGDLDEIRNQLALGASLTRTDADGMTPFDLAASSGRLDAVEVIIEPIRDNRWRLETKPILMEAVGYPDVFLFLLELGAPTRGTFGGESVLIVIARSKGNLGLSGEDQIKMAKAVYEKQPSLLNRADSLGDTPLDWARGTQATELYDYLRSIGARSRDD